MTVAWNTKGSVHWSNEQLRPLLVHYQQLRSSKFDVQKYAITRLVRLPTIDSESDRRRLISKKHSIIQVRIYFSNSYLRTNIQRNLLTERCLCNIRYPQNIIDPPRFSLRKCYVTFGYTISDRRYRTCIFVNKHVHEQCLQLLPTSSDLF